MSIQKNLGIAPPVFVILTLLGVKGFRIGCRSYNKLAPLPNAVPFIQDDLILPEIIFSDFDDSMIEKQICQIFDIIRNTAGLPNNTI